MARYLSTTSIVSALKVRRNNGWYVYHTRHGPDNPLMLPIQKHKTEELIAEVNALRQNNMRELQVRGLPISIFAWVHLRWVIQESRDALFQARQDFESEQMAKRQIIAQEREDLEHEKAVQQQSASWTPLDAAVRSLIRRSRSWVEGEGSNAFRLFFDQN